MLKMIVFRLALATSAMALLTAQAAMAEGEQSKPAPSAFDLDAAPGEGAVPDPLAPSDPKGPPPLAPGAQPSAPSPSQAASPQPAPAATPATQPAPVAATPAQPTPAQPSVAAPIQAEAPPPPPVDPLVAQIRTRLSQGAANRGENKEDVSGLTAYYNDAKTHPIWTTKEGFTPRAAHAVSEIRKADNWGLESSAFSVPDVSGSSPSIETLADAEIKLSIAVLKYARYARGGRIDLSSASDLIDQHARVYDPKSVLQGISNAEAADGYLRGLHPKTEQFKRLRQALLSLEKSEATPPQVKIPQGPNFRPGDQNPQIALIRQRLGLRGFPGQENVYDDAMEDLVRRYQREHGLEANGAIDKKFRASLNEGIVESPSSTRQKIIANMERWRWMPDDLGEIYVWDSIPEQLTRVFVHGKMELMEKIVVGKPATPTPTFSANMQFIVFHPEWGVPDSIKEKELLPKLRRYSGGGGGFSFFGDEGGSGGASRVLRAQGLRVTVNGHEVDPDSIDWSNVDVRRFQFIQSAGGRNVLGVVKFRFPNKHDVYMHDTPERHLFNQTTRAFSHGCMRTQNPVHLAEVLLAHDKGWSTDRVRQLVEEGQTDEIKLTNPIPVHVVYFTAEIGDDGKLRSYPDLYGIDNRVTAALKGEPLRFAAASDNDISDGADPQYRQSRSGYRNERPDGFRGERAEGYRSGPGDYRGQYRPQREWSPFGGLFGGN